MSYLSCTLQLYLKCDDFDVKYICIYIFELDSSSVNLCHTKNKERCTLDDPL